MNILRTIYDELKAMPVGAKQLKDFGFIVGGIVSGLAVFFGFRDGFEPAHVAVGVVGAALVILAFAVPSLLRTPYRAWMSFGIILGFFVFRAFLIAVFFLVFTPVALFMRLIGRDVLRLRPPRKSASFWVSASRQRDMREPY